MMNAHSVSTLTKIRRSVRTQYITGALGLALAVTTIAALSQQHAGTQTGALAARDRFAPSGAAAAVHQVPTPTTRTAATRPRASTVIYVVGSAEEAQRLRQTLDEAAITLAAQEAAPLLPLVVDAGAANELSSLDAILGGWPSGMTVEILDLRSH